jgi:hypothetical protein
MMRQMRLHRAFLTLVIVTTTAVGASAAEADADDTPPTIRPDQAAAFDGREVIVEGRFQSVKTASGFNGRHCVFGFGPSLEEGLVVRVYPRIYKKFPRRPEAYYRGRIVRVRGRIRVREGQPVIVLLSPARLRRAPSEDPDAAPGSPTGESETEG